MNLQCSVDLASNYSAGSQIARVLSEEWCSREMYCPACDSDRLTRSKPNSRPLTLSVQIVSNRFNLKASGIGIRRGLWTQVTTPCLVQFVPTGHQTSGASVHQHMAGPESASNSAHVFLREHYRETHSARTDRTKSGVGRMQHSPARNTCGWQNLDHLLWCAEPTLKSTGRIFTSESSRRLAAYIAGLDFGCSSSHPADSKIHLLFDRSLRL